MQRGALRRTRESNTNSLTTPTRPRKSPGPVAKPPPPAMLPAEKPLPAVRTGKKTVPAGSPSAGGAVFSTLATQLIEWFNVAARDLPWRRTQDPYAIWVSEIMLQQTQVATVIPYWSRWLREFPDVKSLALAPEDRVLKLWEGLGYYSRARNLQRAAQILARDHGGQVPTTTPALRELPGIGPYTAGAIASIAFNQPAALLDGNVIRVLTRLRAWPGDPKGGELNSRLWAEAQRLVCAAHGLPSVHGPGTRGNCSALNQALMELGATLCTPAAPRCGECPWQASCQARARGELARFPELAARPATEKREFATGLIRHRGRWLVQQRGADGLNGGFWEFPSIELRARAEPRMALAEWLGIPAAHFTPAGQLRHAITRYRMVQHLFRADVLQSASIPNSRWATECELDDLALTGPHRRLARESLLPPESARRPAKSSRTRS